MRRGGDSEGRRRAEGRGGARGWERISSGVGGSARGEKRVRVGNPFAQNSNKAGIVGSQGRDDYEAEDVEYYFNYMGILAEEGSNDRMDKLIEAGKHPIDIILLFAAAEGDVPKIEEILEAGADPKITDLDGKTPIELAGINNEAKKDIVVKMLEAAM